MSNSDKLVKFFLADKQARVDSRLQTVKDFTPEEVFQLFQLFRGRNAREIAIFVNQNKIGSRNMSLEDVREAFSILFVNKIQGE